MGNKDIGWQRAGIEALYADPERNPSGSETLTVEPVTIVFIQRFGPVSEWVARIQRQDGSLLDTHPSTLYPAPYEPVKIPAGPDHSECDRWAAVVDDAATISAFLDWLNSRGWFIAEYPQALFTGPYQILERVNMSFDDMVYEYFNIDKRKLDRERRAFLEEAKRHAT